MRSEVGGEMDRPIASSFQSFSEDLNIRSPETIDALPLVANRKPYSPANSIKNPNLSLIGILKLVYEKTANATSYIYSCIFVGQDTEHAVLQIVKVERTEIFLGCSVLSLHCVC
jgi:hypothetical protein